MIETKKIILKTKGNSDIVDITSHVLGFVKKIKIKDGIVLIFVSGSTAGVTIIENEEDLLLDFKNFFEEIVPQTKKYFHDASYKEGNGFAHIRASLLGPSTIVPIKDKELKLGTWQQIVLVDFDIVPRERIVILQIIGE